jgi:glycerophosphoryl diester phosphodiesterase
MDFKTILKYTILTTTLILSACKSTDKELTNTKVSTNKNPEKIEIQNAFKARGFYYTQLGNINYVTKQCNNLELQSHRGSIKYPENSLRAVMDSIDNKFEVIEIDVRRTYSGKWLVHHDEKTGRETGTVDNKQRKISRLRDKELGYLRHRDMETGELTDIMPPSFVELASTFSRYSSFDQKLNIEIKSTYSKSDLENLEYLAAKYIPKGRYFFSSLELRNLQRMREIDNSVHLSFIQEPAKRSIQKLASDLEKGAGNDPIFLRNQDEIARAKRKYNRYAKPKRYDSPLNFSELDKKLSHNYSFALDIRHFNSTFSNLMRYAKKRRIKVSTYTINGQDYHESVLRNIPKSKYPNSVIIDDSVYGFCTAITLPSKKYFSSKSKDAMDIYNLPKDFDFEKIEEFKVYSKNNIYPSLNNGLKTLFPINKIIVKNEKRIKNSMEVGKKQEEEDFDLSLDKSLKIEIRDNK